MEKQVEMGKGGVLRQSIKTNPQLIFFKKAVC